MGRMGKMGRMGRMGGIKKLSILNSQQINK